MAQVKKSKITEIELLDKWIIEDFNIDKRPLLKSIFVNESGRVLYSSHTEIAINFVLDKSFTKIDSDIYENITAGYVYLISIYFILDSIADEENFGLNNTNYKELSLEIPSIFYALNKRFNACLSSDESRKEYGNLIRQTLDLNSKAVKEEIFFRRDPLRKYSKNKEYFNMWARSNVFLFLFQFVGVVFKREIPFKKLDFFSDLLYFLQWGDDAGDWRQDYKNKKWTPLLRQSFTEKGKFLSEYELEEYLYLEGKLKNTLNYIEKGLINVNIDFNIPEDNELSKFILDKAKKINLLKKEF